MEYISILQCDIQVRSAELIDGIVHKRICLILLGLLITGCTSLEDRYNGLNARVEKLIESRGMRQPDYTFVSDEFHETEKYQLLSWANNPLKKDTYIEILNDNEIFVVSYIEGKYSYNHIDSLPNDYKNFIYDILVFDERTQSFVLFSSQLNGPPIELILMGD